ncbi:NifB/NifX family molybdenum-iron cluster-binding protein [Desulfofundulus thermobenzoicus]|nr:NifB/NifX family molybdenum-iron cluster-binding protein [Desulfofundulus thermobenzoicus]
MKVALPVKMGLVDKYFERAKTFLILEIEGTAMKKSFFSVNPSQSNRKQVIELFQKSGVKLIIVDKIGTKAKQTLSENGFQVNSPEAAGFLKNIPPAAEGGYPESCPAYLTCAARKGGPVNNLKDSPGTCKKGAAIICNMSTP